MSDTSERQRFETWHAAKYPNSSLEKADEALYGQGAYCKDPVRNRWIGWQARAGASTAELPKGEPVPIWTYEQIRAAQGAVPASNDQQEKASPADALDAKRYRWLGSHCTLVEQDKRSSLPGLRLVVHAQSWTTCADWSKLNEAIDSAMASNQTPLAPSGD